MAPKNFFKQPKGQQQISDFYTSIAASRLRNSQCEKLTESQDYQLSNESIQTVRGVSEGADTNRCNTGPHNTPSQEHVSAPDNVGQELPARFNVTQSCTCNAECHAKVRTHSFKIQTQIE